jgi:mutator protein MutT
MNSKPTPLTSNGAPAAKWVDVAVAAIYRRVGGRVELLVARRHDHAIRGGLWEFPGGKIEHGEHPSEAAIREAREEVGFAAEEFVSQPAPLVVVEHSDPELARERSVRLHAFLAEVKPNAVPQALGASEIRWIGVEQIPEFEWPKANASINTAIASALG